MGSGFGIGPSSKSSSPRGCGGRKSLGLGVYDVDTERARSTSVTARGTRSAYVPIGERALAWIGKYLDVVSPELDGGRERRDALPHEARDGRWTPMALTGRVRGYVKESGIGKKGSCHLFRHTMATLMLEGGADVRYVQEMLGHMKLETTQIYTRV